MTRCAWLVLGGAICATNALAQNSSDTPDDAVVMSPYTVETNSDRGYYSPNAVSGTRTRTELINLPINMSVFTDEFIRDIHARDLNDVVTYAAGVNQGTGGGSATNDGDTLGFSIRGQAAFLPYRNGFRRLRAVDPATIERVEVVKGPSSVLYGLLNPGGMINYITKRPVQNRRITDVTATVGSYELYRGMIDYNVPSENNKVAVRFVGSIEDSQSITRFYNNQTKVYYPSIRWWIQPQTTLTLEYERTERHINGFKSGVPYNATLDFEDQHYPIDRSWNTHAPSDYSDTDIDVYTAELIHQFNRNWTARANWTHEIWFDNVLQNGGNINLTSATSNLLNPRTMSYGKRGSWDDYKQFEVVNNFEWHGIGSQTIFGYQHGSEEYRQVLGTIAPPTQGVQWNVRDPSTWIVSAQHEHDIAGIAANTGLKATNVIDSYYVTNQLSFANGRVRTLAGYRIDKITAKTYDPSAPPATQSTSIDIPSIKSPQVGVVFKPLEGLALFANYSEAAVNLYTSLQRHTDGTFFLPTPGHGKGYDFGVKSEMFDGRIAGTVSVFEVENANIVRLLAQQQLPDGTLFTPADQSGTDRSTGIEVDLRLRPFKGNQVLLSYANTDAYVKSDVQTGTTINGVRVLTREGHRLQNAPQNTAAIWVRQDLGTFGPVANVYVAGGGHYIDSRRFTETYNVINGTLVPPPDLDAYYTFDVSVGGEFSVGKTHLYASLSAKNITDEVYMAERYHFGAPRTFEFTVRTSF